VALAGSRVLITWMVGRVSSRLADDPPTLRRWGAAGLVSQAGLALSIAFALARNFPSFGDGFRSLAIATVALNEMIGPVVFKLVLDRVGETSTAPVRRRPSTSVAVPPAD